MAGHVMSNRSTFSRNCLFSATSVIAAGLIGGCATTASNTKTGSGNTTVTSKTPQRASVAPKNADSETPSEDNGNVEVTNIKGLGKREIGTVDDLVYVVAKHTRLK